MILCSCNNISETKLKELMEKENLTKEEALKKLGFGEKCGICKIDIRK